MQQFVKQSSFKKHLNLILIKFKLAFKTDLEYKINIWMMLFETTVLILIYSLFYSTYNSFTKEIIPWTQTDFILLLFLLITAGQIMWSFSITKFQNYLLNGQLNKSLIRPINPYIDTINMNTRGATMIIFPILASITLIIILTNNYSNHILALINFIIGTIFYIIFFSCIYSLTFFLKTGNTIAETIRRVGYTSDEFTPKIFETTIFRNFFYLLPSSIAGYFTIEILNNRIELISKFQPIIFLIIIIFIIILYLLWHFGLKKYEGYN